MLLNLSNHQLSKWSDTQRGAAEGLFGAIVDIPFPAIEPMASLEEIEKMVQDYVQLCLTHLEQHNDYAEENAVHIMGEYTFTYLFVREMEKRYKKKPNE